MQRTFAALLLMLAWSASAAEIKSKPASAPKALGKLDPFWRYSAVLGPVLERGYGLIEIPAYLAQGDFPYRKRPYREEVPFADHLSVVRLLGGYDDGDTNGEHPRDLAYRGSDKKIHYRMELLHQRLQPYREQGYTNLTLVLDNIPWCFPAQPTTGKYGQLAPPSDPQEWSAFIKAMCEELVKIFGRPTAQQLRFRVGTENQSRKRFDGTFAEFVRHYDASATAIRAVLPTAKVGPFNIGGASVHALERENVSALALAQHCLSHHIPFDWVSFSRYYAPGEDVEDRARGCLDIWRTFEQRLPSLKGVSREIHEFGIAPFGEESKGVFVSGEPGALGAAMTCQMMLRLREAGINRLWHWKVYDGVRDHDRKKQYLFDGQAWLLSVLDRMTGSDAWLLPAGHATTRGTDCMVLGCFNRTNSYFLISAYNPKLAAQPPATITFRCPQTLRQQKGQTCRLVRLNRQTAVFDRMRADLAGANLLEQNFISHPDRLGDIGEMGRGPAATSFVTDRWRTYTQLWTDSLRLRPFAPADGKIEIRPDALTVQVQVSAPEIVVLRFD